jgi:aspartate kinase
MATRVRWAAALKAECCEIIKEVDGVCSADPAHRGKFKALASAGFYIAIRNVFLGRKGLAFSQRGAGTKPKRSFV